MSLHDEWSLINIIMLLGCVSLTPLCSEYAYVLPGLLVHHVGLFPSCPFSSLRYSVYRSHIPRPLFHFPYSSANSNTCISLKAYHMPKRCTVVYVIEDFTTLESYRARHLLSQCKIMACMSQMEWCHAVTLVMTLPWDHHIAFPSFLKAL